MTLMSFWFQLRQHGRLLQRFEAAKCLKQNSSKETSSKRWRLQVTLCYLSMQLLP